MVEFLNRDIRSVYTDNMSLSDVYYYLQSLDDVKRENLIRLFLSDYYKLAFFECLIKKDFELLRSFNDNIDYLIENSIHNPNILGKILNASKKFNSLSYFSKAYLMDLFYLFNQDEILSNISNLYIFDKSSYSFDYDLESFKIYYLDFSKREDVLKNKTFSTYIASKLLEYKEENYKEYSKYILEFLKEYYKWTLFISKTQNKDSLDFKDYVYLDIINLKSLEELVEYSIKDFDFLSTIIDNYLYYTCNKETSDSIIEEFFNQNVSHDIKNKLKIKEAF